MGTLEKTIFMIETLPEVDLIKIQDFLHNIKKAEKEIASGKYRKAEEVFDGLEQR